jgi:hypothetical protein
MKPRTANARRFDQTYLLHYLYKPGLVVIAPVVNRITAVEQTAVRMRFCVTIPYQFALPKMLVSIIAKPFTTARSWVEVINRRRIWPLIQ